MARHGKKFLEARGRVAKPETARLMVRNHNPAGVTPRGLGFDVGQRSGSPGCSERAFGHTGSMGTLCWADSPSETICVVLTSLPRVRAGQRHPAVASECAPAGTALPIPADEAFARCAQAKPFARTHRIAHSSHST